MPYIDSLKNIQMKENICNSPDLKIKPRDYKCPCGKAYLSYPALFTHIKQKHNGKAPGEIQRPSKPNRTNHILMECQKNFVGDGWEFRERERRDRERERERDEGEVQRAVNRGYWEEFSYLFALLKKVEKPENSHIKLWTNLESFKKLEQFLDDRHPHLEPTPPKPCLGSNLSQFFKAVSLNTESHCFEQILILFTSLLQYVIEENPNKNVLRQAPIDILIEYVNPFISYYLRDFVQVNGLAGLWIMRRENVNKVFMCFYNWLKWKCYTNFCITLIE